MGNWLVCYPSPEFSVIDEIDRLGRFTYRAARSAEHLASNNTGMGRYRGYYGICPYHLCRGRVRCKKISMAFGFERCAYFRLFLSEMATAVEPVVDNVHDCYSHGGCYDRSVGR